MLYDAERLPDRDFQFLRDNLIHLNSEVTRYRDIEWKATAFHAAVLAAIAYVLLDENKRPDLGNWRMLVAIGVIVYTALACGQLL